MMKKIYTVLLFAIFLYGLPSCQKNGIVNRTTPASNTRIIFVHAVPESIQLNFFAGDTKLTGAQVNSTSLLPQGMGYNTANQPAWLPYTAFTEGNNRIRAILPQNYGVAAGDTIMAGETVLDTSYTFTKDQPYSLFAYGTAKDVKCLILGDTLVNNQVEAGIRFVNLMPGAVRVDLEMTYTAPGSTTPSTTFFAENIGFGEVAHFKALKPGAYTFQRKRTGTSTLVGSALTIARLNAGQNYTLCARGTLAALSQIAHQ